MAGAAMYKVQDSGLSSCECLAVPAHMHVAHPAMNWSNSGAMASAIENRRGRTKFWTVKKPA